MIEATRKSSQWMTIVEVVFLVAALGVGIVVAMQDFGSAVPLILGMVGFVLLRYILHRPFHEGFTLYMALAAFNYYYFYCAKLTGRNPTDVGAWGLPATALEKMQKDIVFFLLLGLGMVKLFRNRLEGYPFWSRRLNHPILKLTLLFIIFTLFRGIFWVFQGDTTFDLLFYLRTNIEFAVIPFLLCTSLIDREKDLRTVLKGLIYTLPIVAILGIIEFLLHGSPYERSFYGGQAFSRATATLQNPNNLGGYLAVTMGVYILYFFKNQLNKYERWLFWPTMPLGFACLFMTLSRSSIVFFFVSLTVCFALLYATSRKEMGRERFIMFRNLMLTYLLTLSGCIFVLYKYFDFQHALSDALEMYVQASVVSNNRLYAPVTSMASLLLNPMTALFGYSKAEYLLLSDNVFANVLIRNGIIGFLIYISIWFKALFSSFVALWRSAEHRSTLHLFSFYILLFLGCYGFTAPINENFPHNMYFWFVVGIVVWLDSKPAPEPSASRKQKKLPVPEMGTSPVA